MNRTSKDKKINKPNGNQTIQYLNSEGDSGLFASTLDVLP